MLSNVESSEISKEEEEGGVEDCRFWMRSRIFSVQWMSLVQFGVYKR
jgi:hypothetical protein